MHQRKHQIWISHEVSWLQGGREKFGVFQSVRWDNCTLPQFCQKQTTDLLLWSGNGLQFKTERGSNYSKWFACYERQKSLLLSALRDFPEHLAVLNAFLLTSILLSQFKKWKPAAQKHCDPAPSRPKERRWCQPSPTERTELWWYASVVTLVPQEWGKAIVALLNQLRSPSSLYSLLSCSLHLLGQSHLPYLLLGIWLFYFE